MPDVAPVRFPLGRLLVLAGAVFATMSTQFLPTGLLPEMAADLQVAEPLIGQLLTVFAVTVAVTAWPLTMVTRRFSRKRMLVVVLALFALANVLSALAPTYEVLLAVRVLGGILHGLTWAIAVPYTALLVPGTQMARGMTVTNSGASFAFLIGVPLTAAVGHATDWRIAFVVMAGIIAALAVLTAVALPSASHLPAASDSTGRPSARGDRTLPAVLIVAVATLLIASGHNILYGYVTPWAIDAGVPGETVSLLLLACGLAGLAGLAMTALLADRRPRAVFNVQVLLMVCGILLLAGLGTGVAAVFALAVVWTFGFGGLPTQFNARALRDASGPLRPMTGAIIATAFNLAIAAGALVGGAVFAGFGIRAVPWWAGAVVTAGLVWVVATDRARLARSAARTQGAAASAHR